MYFTSAWRMCFSSAAESKAEKPHLLGERGESLLWGFLSSQQRGNPSFPAGICLVLLSQPSHSRSLLPCQAPAHPGAGRAWNCGGGKEREAGKAAVRSGGELAHQALRRRTWRPFSLWCSKGLLILVWVWRAEPDQTWRAPRSLGPSSCNFSSVPGKLCEGKQKLKGIFLFCVLSL